MRPLLPWFVFTVGFGLLPFGFAVLVVALEQGSIVPLPRSPELLFFVVMICGAQLGASFTQPTRRGRQRRGAENGWASGGFLLVAVVAAGLYGVYVDRERHLSSGCREFLQNPVNPAANVTSVTQRVNLDSCPEDVTFLENLFLFSAWLAAALIVGGTLAEGFRTRRSPWKLLP